MGYELNLVMKLLCLNIDPHEQTGPPEKTSCGKFLMPANELIWRIKTMFNDRVVRMY